MAAGVGSSPSLLAADWVDITSPLLTRLTNSGAKADWPGGCAGVVVNRTNGAVTVKVVGLGLWRSPDLGTNWQRVDGNTVSGRDETGWATSVDQNNPGRMSSFALDGAAGWTSDGEHWRRFADLGRNWDYGSVDWSAHEPRTIIGARHETKPPGEVYVSTNGGSSWRLMAPHLNEQRGRPSMVGALAADVLILCKGNGVERSTDLGETWTRVSDWNALTRIPVYFQGAHYLGGTNGLQVSWDRGATWRPLGSPVPSPVWQGPFFGRSAAEILVVSRDGVYFTSDGGAEWKRVAELKSKEKGFLFTADWFGCYAWDPVNDFLYAAAMGNPVYRLKLAR